MEAKLIINGTDFSNWIQAGGLRQEELIRQGRSVVTLDGTEYRGQIIKRKISVSLVELRDGTWLRLLAALQTRPASVTYDDDRTGRVTRLFHVGEPSAAAKTVRGGHTYFQDGTFTLEEM